MNHQFLQALSDLIDAKVELALAKHSDSGCHVGDDDDDRGGYDSFYEQRKVQEAEAALHNLISKPQPRAFPESGMVLDIRANRATVIEGSKVIETRDSFL